MLAPADQPPDDILDYVVVDTDKTGQIHVRVVEGKKHLRAVQDYLTRLCSRYPGKVSPFEFTTLDVIARLRQETVISGVENGINPVQQKMLGYISHAATLSASDLHITPGRDSTDFTYLEARVHGELELLDIVRKDEGLELLGATYSGMTDVIKGTQFDPGVPQDARLAERFLKLAGLFGARYSHYPCVGGLYAVLRLIKDDSQHIPTFSMLGYHPEQERAVRRMLQRPEGIVILSGPTGSGKSTTLQRNMIKLLQEKNYEINLITVEDPPEYPIPGARQMPVTNANDEEEKDEQFNKALSAALRSDPDVIMVGEIRALAAAELTFKGALSGHGVWSTLHANSAPAIITRFRDMGVQPYMLADPELMKGLISQRLFRKLCPHCRVSVKEKLNMPQVQRLKVALGDFGIENTYMRGPGCKFCDGRGIKGRMSVPEIILPDAMFLELMINGETRKAIDYWTSDLNGRPLKDAAIERMLKGYIDLDEVERWCGLLDQRPVY